MSRFKFSKLRDIAQGDFAIKDGSLFYKDKEIAAGGTILFDSSEEVFFLFNTEEQTSLDFKHVIVQNYYQCSFYPCIEFQRNGDRLGFKTPDNKQYVFRRCCYNGNINSSKIVGGSIR